MTNEEIDKEALQAEIGQIKEAMGLHERYPYMTKLWLTEGILVGILSIVLQIIVYRDISFFWYGIVAVGIVIVEQVVFRRIVRNAERTATGPKPSLTVLIVAITLGVFALFFGLDPVIAHQTVNEAVVSAVVVTALFGVLYLSVGNMLIAYSIRKTDRYAIHIGGLWLFVLAAAITHVPLLQRWAYAAIGVSVIVHGIGSYLVLQRM